MYRGSSRPSWVSVFLWLLLHSLPDLSASSSPPLWISSYVGHEATLPCNWTSLMQTAQQPDLSPYLQWRTPKESVFEMREEERYEGIHFRGRVGVEVQHFKNGDCSLLMREVQFSDTGRYDSFITVGRRRRRRSFIDSVQLIVRDHKYKEVLKEGQNLELELHTHLASTVIFQRAGAPESQMIWERDSGAWGSRDWGSRLTQGDEKRERLILSGVEDGGCWDLQSPGSPWTGSQHSASHSGRSDPYKDQPVRC
ncbi:hypothetical protein AGOR_G00043790 [Albula goreensis]|uniref:Immunoglobulin V-set domain-containing protein n=1 Tax=Albula goreensis TaxID=1534307 RepID=A0A8T3DZ55_9TELE|nr:hypothetical protein AGOR_G00043790 [Albula goreensis]